MKNLLSKDWIKYLEREQALVIFSSFMLPYGALLKETTGFCYSDQLHYFKHGRGIFYRSAKETELADRYFSTLIKRKDRRINEWIEKEKEVCKQFACATFEDVTLTLTFLNDILLYNTVIPYRLLSALQFVEDKELQGILEQIRSRSLYPFFFKKMEHFFGQAAVKLHIDPELAALMTSEELKQVLVGNKKIDITKLEKRKKGCYFYAQNNDIKFTYETANILEEIFSANPVELCGSAAYRGKVVGTVKIINTLDQISCFEEGKILVSINTNPALMPAMEKAAALVTDEGGILCHAAIVARELKKPCIIGTKIATKVLKDGDFVEVDADTGVVRVLKSKQISLTMTNIAGNHDI